MTAAEIGQKLVQAGYVAESGFIFRWPAWFIARVIPGKQLRENGQRDVFVVESDLDGPFVVVEIFDTAKQARKYVADWHDDCGDHTEPPLSGRKMWS